MTEGSAPQYRPSEEEEVAVGRIGLILFAAILMMMGGVFQAFTGLVAIFNDQFLIPTREYLFQFDITTWGWIHLILGIVVALAGVGLLAVLRYRQLHVHPSLPGLGAAGHRPGRLRDLGAGRARPGAPRRQRLSGDLTAAATRR